MMDENIIDNVALAAKQIIEVESRHNFEVYAIDDSEHIPRMARIADAVRDFFVALGVPPSRSEEIADDLLDYARQLYIAEWMRPEPQDEEPPLKKEAIESFNKYLGRKRKRTRS